MRDFLRHGRSPKTGQTFLFYVGLIYYLRVLSYASSVLVYLICLSISIFFFWGTRSFIWDRRLRIWKDNKKFPCVKITDILCFGKGFKRDRMMSSVFYLKSTLKFWFVPLINNRSMTIHGQDLKQFLYISLLSQSTELLYLILLTSSWVVPLPRYVLKHRTDVSTSSQWREETVYFSSFFFRYFYSHLDSPIKELINYM